MQMGARRTIRTHFVLSPPPHLLLLLPFAYLSLTAYMRARVRACVRVFHIFTHLFKFFVLDRKSLIQLRDLVVIRLGHRCNQLYNKLSP